MQRKPRHTSEGSASWRGDLTRLGIPGLLSLRGTLDACSHLSQDVLIELGDDESMVGMLFPPF